MGRVGFIALAMIRTFGCFGSRARSNTFGPLARRSALLRAAVLVLMGVCSFLGFGRSVIMRTMTGTLGFITFNDSDG